MRRHWVCVVTGHVATSWSLWRLPPVTKARCLNHLVNGCLWRWWININKVGLLSFGRSFLLKYRLLEGQISNSRFLNSLFSICDVIKVFPLIQAQKHELFSWAACAGDKSFGIGCSGDSYWCCRNSMKILGKWCTGRRGDNFEPQKNVDNELNNSINKNEAVWVICFVKVY